jgi:endoglucanase
VRPSLRGWRGLSLAALLLAFASALFLLAGPAALRTKARHAVGRLLGAVRRFERRRLPEEEALFSHLATSQVGYGPFAQKQFTSPRPFTSFVVLDETTPGLALQGTGPVRSVKTDVLGPFTSVFVGDFSALVRPGRYRVRADNGLESYAFTVGPDVFDGPLRAVSRWFYFQRSFAEVDAAHAEGPWTHPSDADKAPAGVHGGWHDAGDFSLYSAYLNPALFWLLLSYADFAPTLDDTNIPESHNGLPDVLDEARVGLAWLLSTQDGQGGFRNTTCQDSYGPYGTNTPNSVPRYRDGEVGTLATARAVGNLAFASSLYRTLDAAFSEACLRAAEKGVVYLDAHPGETTDGPSCPSARADGDARVGRSARSFAAAGMLLATGEARFARDFEASFTEPDYNPHFLYLDGQAALLYLHAAAADEGRKRALRVKLAINAAEGRSDGAAHPFGWAGRYHWGSLGAGFVRAGLFSVPVCLEDREAARADCEQALSSLHYAFGRNLKQFCFVSGMPGASHGMHFGFHQWLAALRAEPRDFPGMVAGGPNERPEWNDVSTPQARPVPVWGYFGDPSMPRDAMTPIDARYTDNDSWSTNEADVEWEGEAVYLLHFAQWLTKNTARPHGP